MIREKKEQILKYVCGTAHLLLAFMGACGFCHVLGLAGFERSSYTVFDVLIMAAVWKLLDWTWEDLGAVRDKRMRKRRIRFAAVFSFLFSMAMIMGYQLQNTGMTAAGFRGKKLILLHAACLTAAVFPAGNYLFRCAERIAAGRKGAERKQLRPAAVFGVSAAVIFLCLIPVWLAYYPIVMSYDFHRQVNEAAKGFEWFYPYQPIAHTWLIWFFLRVGEFLGSSQKGMACMALFQMLLYSLVTAYASVTVYRAAKRRWPMILTVLFFALFPFNTVLVVCTTKDTIFSVLFLLFFLLFVERSFLSAGRKRIVVNVLMVLAGCLMVQFRNNAIYAVAAFAVLFFLLAPGKEKLEVLLLAVLLVVGGKAAQSVILRAIGTQIGASEVDMYCVPIQQMACVGYRQGDNLAPETAELLNSYLPADIWQDYNPSIADPVKNSGKIDSGRFTNEKKQLLRDWITIGRSYPNEYLDAFLELTRGYWFPDDVSWAENLGYGVEERMGAVFTYNSSEIENVGSIEHETKFPWLERQLEKIVSGNSFYDWPVISLFFKSAFYTWGLFFAMLAYLYLGQKRQFLVGLFPLLYFATMLFGPVVWIRYVLPMMSVLPVMLALLCWKEDGERETARNVLPFWEKEDIIAG